MIKAPCNFVVPESITAHDKHAVDLQDIPQCIKPNNSDLDDVQVELSDLNPLEIHLISLQTLFMKMVALRILYGKQCSYH